MEYLRIAFQKAYQIANIEIDLFGYKISMWALFMFVVIVGIVMWVIVDGFE